MVLHILVVYSLRFLRTSDPEIVQCLKFLETNDKVVDYGDLPDGETFKLKMQFTRMATVWRQKIWP